MIAQVARPDDLISRVRFLSQEKGWSARRIARELGIARESVSKIISPPAADNLPKVYNPDRDHAEKTAFAFRPTYHRCVGCGGMVQDGVPCLLCTRRAEQLEQMKKVAQETDEFIEDLLGPPITKSPLDYGE